MKKINAYKIKEKSDAAFEGLKAHFGYKNKMEAPVIQKVVVSVGTGKMRERDAKKPELVLDRLSKVTGQKAAIRTAKKSIASFKTRTGDPIGAVVTLRGGTMYGFLEKFFNIALPRTKDFRGVSTRAVDDMGNLTIGVKEHTIFPETSDEELKDVFGMAVTIVTSAKNKGEARAFFEYLGVPFAKTLKNK